MALAIPERGGRRGARGRRTVNKSFLGGLIDQIVDRGRSLVDLSLVGLGQGETIEDLARALLSGRGESSGVAIAQRILSVYRTLEEEAKAAFFTFLLEEFCADPTALHEAASDYLDHPGQSTLDALARAIESPRQEFFRRLNLAPGGTAEIVAMRADLLAHVKQQPELGAVDADIVHLFGAWFNRGFLVCRRIDWATPAAVLEKIIEYEAVHEIRGWDDLKRRLDPADRRCYGFFHPSLLDEPLIFVEVALTRDMPASIQDLLDEEATQQGKPPTTAVFYSISNCQKGLAGISFGNFLIKQVVTDLAREIDSLKTFVTLSPMPVFARWLGLELGSETSSVLGEEQRRALAALDEEGWHEDKAAVSGLRDLLMRLGAYYLSEARTPGGRLVDPVARFHLGNGARLERVNWLGDISEHGIAQSAGLMVNYLYDLDDIERNHEAFANDETVAAASAVQKLARAAGAQVRKDEAPTTEGG